ncbi:MAG: hypothetical protein ACOVQX_01370 [Legionella sp.]
MAKLLHKEVEKELPFVHKTGLNGLMNACTTAAQNNTLYNEAWTKRFCKHKNKHLHRERAAFDHSMATRLISR